VRRAAFASASFRSLIRAAVFESLTQEVPALLGGADLAAKTDGLGDFSGSVIFLALAENVCL
jgi:hypothetical protein